MPASKLHSSEKQCSFTIRPSTAFNLPQWLKVRSEPSNYMVKSDGTEPFCSRANSLPGANRPIGLGRFAPWPSRSLALSFPGHFAPWNFRSVALSLPTVKITVYCEKNSYKEIKVT